MKKMFDSSESSNLPPPTQLASVLCAQNQFAPSEVVQWSNHRVMEWLRSVDLAEYAPNLRGSGVHGGLIVSAHGPRRRVMMVTMVTMRMRMIPTPLGLPSPQMLEPRFNSDTLAMLLNIPPQKTLLRRHLTTNFNSLVGTQAQQEKREYTDAAGYSPISITAKVKVAAAREGDEGGREVEGGGAAFPGVSGVRAS